MHLLLATCIFGFRVPALNGSCCSLSFLKLFFFLMWTICKVFIEFVAILILPYVLDFWPWVVWDPSSPARDEHVPAALEGGSLNPQTARGVPGFTRICSLLLFIFSSDLKKKLNILSWPLQL